MPQLWSAWCALTYHDFPVHRFRKITSEVHPHPLETFKRAAAAALWQRGWLHRDAAICCYPTDLHSQCSAQAGYLYLTNVQRLHALMIYLGLGGIPAK